MEKVFRSKVDAWLVILMAFIILACFSPVLVYDFTWTVLSIAVLFAVLVFGTMFGIRYYVVGSTLVVKNWIVGKSSYDIMTICSVKSTHTLLSSPAASIDRLEIRFSNRRRPLVISPVRKDDFIALLASINKGIIVW